jgi:transketolase
MDVDQNILRFNQCPDTRRLANRIRRHTLHMTSRGGSSHIGSIFSVVDIVSVLYGRVARFDPTNPRHRDRDRIVLSKGHAGAAIYAVLAELGFFPLDELNKHYQDGSNLSGHVSHKGIPGVEFSTGSLGHGLPVAVGMAYAAKMRGDNHRVFVIMSDGECDEGSNWEAIMFAAHHGLSNLTAVIDYNKLQSLASVAETLQLEPFADKWEAFGWSTQEVGGHDHDALGIALGSVSPESNTPRCVIAHTVKGKGVSFMENSVLWHYRTARGDEFDAALAELTSEESSGGQ